MLADAVGETSETTFQDSRFHVGYRNEVGRGGVSWPACSSLEEAKEELARRKTEETGAPNGISFWYIEERQLFARTTVVLAEAP